jgi:dynein heavy chain
MLAPLAAGTADVYARACASLLPTPSRSHYVFSLRDVGRVLQARWRSSRCFALAC